MMYKVVLLTLTIFCIKTVIAQGSGECKIWCPPSTKLNEETCSCECTNKDQCLPPRIFKPNLCDCTCPNKKTCYFPKFLNKTTCDCDCWFKFCRKPQVKNLDTCKCECPVKATCPHHQFLDKDCVCKCSNVDASRCSTKQYFNHDTCLCQCRRIENCKSNQTFNENSCECQCKGVLPCPDGRVYNPDTCMCECTNKCGANLKHKEGTCECIPDPNSSCQSLQHQTQCEATTCSAGKCRWHRYKGCYCPCCTAKSADYVPYCNYYGLTGGITKCRGHRCVWNSECT